MSNKSRVFICKTISDMLDNPDDNGIYPTTKAFDALESYIDELEDKIHEINQWADEYPLESFPKQDLELAESCLRHAGLSLEAVLADQSRHILNQAKEICKI